MSTPEPGAEAAGQSGESAAAPDGTQPTVAIPVGLPLPPPPPPPAPVRPAAPVPPIPGPPAYGQGPGGPPTYGQQAPPQQPYGPGFAVPNPYGQAVPPMPPAQGPGGYGQAPGGYGQAPGYPGYPGYGAPPRTNGMAIASMVVGICSLLFICAWGLGIIPGVVAVTLGTISRKQLRVSGENGNGMALAGIICGAIAIALGVLAIILLIALIASSPGSGDYPRSTTF